MAFTAYGVPLSEPGFRVLVRPSGSTVRVVVRGVSGGSDAVRICPVEGVSGPPRDERCVVAGDGRPVDLAGVAGLLLRPVEGAAGAANRVAEMTLTYVPDDDQITLVTPSLGPSQTPGDCPGGRCEMAFELTPTGAGTFVLQADGRGARPQLTLRAGPPDDPRGGGSRVLSVVEGGGRLTVRSSVDGRSDASLVLRNQGAGDLPPLELSLVWPGRR